MADIGEVVEQKWNGALKQTAGGFWSGAKQVGASGFGKGLLITAGIILAGAALIFGFGASLGEITVRTAPTMFSASTAATATTGQGVMLGLGKAAQFLMHPAGWAALGAGGIMGVFTLGHTNDKISAERAQLLAKQYELSRNRGPQQQIEHSGVTRTDHAITEDARRANTAGRTMQPQLQAG